MCSAQYDISAKAREENLEQGSKRPCPVLQLSSEPEDTQPSMNNIECRSPCSEHTCPANQPIVNPCIPYAEHHQVHECLMRALVILLSRFRIMCLTYRVYPSPYLSKRPCTISRESLPASSIWPKHLLSAARSSVTDWTWRRQS